MKNNYCTPILCAVLALSIIGSPAYACSWAAFANGKAALVARTMDWYCNDNAIMKGHGRNMPVKAADSPNALEYRSKYASLQVHSFDNGPVSEGMNEKGLQGSMLYLEGSRQPAALPARKDVCILNLVSYALDNFASVQELVDSLSRINIISPDFSLPGSDGKRLAYKKGELPLHFAFADASGDKVVIEFLKGELNIYHGKEHSAMTNEPAYEVHLAVEAFGLRPDGSIGTIDRWGRARAYLRDMHERGVADSGRALAAMRGLLASVWAGTEEIDRTENEVYPTIWGALADQNSKKYYVTRYNTWCWEQYDFSMFAIDKPEAVALQAKACPYAPMDLATDGAKPRQQ